jgi:hypothetical protein
MPFRLSKNTGAPSRNRALLIAFGSRYHSRRLAARRKSAAMIFTMTAARSGATLYLSALSIGLI